MIRYACRCGARYTLSDDLAGRKVRCRKCGEKGTVPLVTVEPRRLEVPSEDELAGMDLDEFEESPE